ncbi:Hcp family type VI secretion system effector [Pluralibacter gergoviae]|uniref:Hcp family type VI secretion system effector n=1 Tax=Pluralibacter gergoviae TaxID=61647 RepID=UPI00155EB719|nr:type VI secretion system tube protein TssD [Pluralibacter gergoviae]
MSNPAYLWLTDDRGAPMEGSCMVSGRIGAIELSSLTHNINIPTDNHTGKLSGTRVHAPIMFQKDFDKTTPLLYKAISLGLTLKSAAFKMYTIDDAGIEREYFNILLANVKIVSITPDLYPGSGTGKHLETILIRYEKIMWKHCEGNIQYTDEWNQRVTM